MAKKKPKPKAKPKQPGLLAKELQAIGCKLTAEQFRLELLDLFRNHFPKWTDEQLLCRPRDAMHLCSLMRGVKTCCDAPDDLILRTLVNSRKAGLRRQ